MNKQIIALGLTAALFTAGFSQNREKPVGITLGGGLANYNGDLGNGFFKMDPLNLHGHVGVNAWLNPSFDLGLAIAYGDWSYKKDSIQSFKSRLFHGNINLKYKFNNGYILKEESVFAPYIFAGVGSSEIIGFYKDANGNKLVNESKGVDFTPVVGAGLKFNLSKTFSVFYQNTVGFLPEDDYENRIGKGNDMFMLHTAGIGFNVGKGKPKDSDKDGVADKLDKCPATPAGVTVDADGCPVDGDKDGIADYLDKCPDQAGIAKFGGCPDTDGDDIVDAEDECPTVKGLAAFKGCPDTDNDGIADKDDKCPTKAGKKEFNGCPDTDNDGIADIDDKCPNQAGKKEFKGCPDTDNDGIADNEDKCPTVAGKKEFNGCPDTDNDGIADNEDKCPTEAGIAANKGCPEVKAEVKKLFEKALTGIQFETGKAIIKKTSFGILMQVAKVMNENPSWNLLINGHTDDQGDDAKNLVLSQDRANAVLAYLKFKEVAETRMKSTGYGETAPVADNKTAAGRAKNRRVEFKVLFEEIVK